MPGPGVTRILEDLVLKYDCDSRVAEAENSEFVRKNTNIPVPKVLLVFCLKGFTGIVFEFIKGTPLRDYWGEVGDEERSSIIATTASYISQLRSLEAPPRPGPVNPLAAWRGRWFTNYDLEPLPSHAALVDWLNHKRAVCERFNKLGDSGTARPFTTDYDLVFTHGDIAPRNFVVDDNRVLWLIDWDTAGWYPAYMEYTTIVTAQDDMHNPIFGWEDWVKSITAAIDCYDEETQMLWSIWWALNTGPFIL
ncbi:kinase-like domain-containing protein [Lyophyllum atratum]|nr:kinase-like domain-containing protein [Lyophyllum atratum]